MGADSLAEGQVSVLYNLMRDEKTFFFQRSLLRAKIPVNSLKFVFIGLGKEFAGL